MVKKLSCLNCAGDVDKHGFYYLKRQKAYRPRFKCKDCSATFSINLIESNCHACGHVVYLTPLDPQQELDELVRTGI
jgi:transposase-like protein